LGFFLACARQKPLDGKEILPFCLFTAEKSVFPNTSTFIISCSIFEVYKPVSIRVICGKTIRINWCNLFADRQVRGKKVVGRETGRRHPTFIISQQLFAEHTLG
jgi:hypothetical protein